MTRYSIQPRDRIFVRDYRFLSFAKITASKEAIQKTAETSDHLIGDKISNNIAKVSTNSPQNNSRGVTS